MKLLAALLLLSGCMPAPRDFESAPSAWICSHDDDDAGVLECIEVVEV
jgi:hypothetical protein